MGLHPAQRLAPFSQCKGLPPAYGVAASSAWGCSPGATGDPADTWGCALEHQAASIGTQAAAPGTRLQPCVWEAASLRVQAATPPARGLRYSTSTRCDARYGYHEVLHLTTLLGNLRGGGAQVLLHTAARPCGHPAAPEALPPACSAQGCSPPGIGRSLRPRRVDAGGRERGRVDAGGREREAAAALCCLPYIHMYIRPASPWAHRCWPASHDPSITLA